MAYGFQNTCDTDEYFYLDNVPGYVSVNEFFYIETLEGEDFCGKYVNIPEVDYQILTYTLLGMTAQTNANACQQINPCPTVLINFPANTGVPTNVNECLCLTEYPLGVGCVVPNVTPQTPNVTVNLKISGGTAPYTIYLANTNNQLGTVSTNGGTSTISTLRPSGTYCFDVYDFYQTKVSHCCTVGTASTLLSASYTVTNSDQCSNTGIITVNINGGTPPYTVYKNGVSEGTTTQFTGLAPGSSTFYVTDSSDPVQTTTTQTKTVAITPINYPQNICMSVNLCNQTYKKTFYKSPTTLCPPTYLSSTGNWVDIGIEDNINLIYDSTTQKWRSSGVAGQTPVGSYNIDTEMLSAPSSCQIPSNNLKFESVSSGPNIMPAGNYTGLPAFANATSIIVTNGICQNPPTFTTTVQNTCAGSSSGVITVVPQNGTPPYTVVFNNIEYPTQTIFNNLAAGAYTISVSDSLNLESSSSIVNVTASSSVPMTQITQCQTIEGENFSNNNFGDVFLRLNLTFNNIPPGNTITIGGIDGNINILRINKSIFGGSAGSGGVSYTFQGIKINKNNNPIPLDTIVTSDLSQGNFGLNAPINPPLCTSNLYRGLKTDSITNTNINDIQVVNGDSLMIELRAYIGIELPAGIMPPSCYNALIIQPALSFINVTDDIPSDVCYDNTITNYTFIPGVEVRRYYGTQELVYLPYGTPAPLNTCPPA